MWADFPMWTHFPLSRTIHDLFFQKDLQHKILKKKKKKKKTHTQKEPTQTKQNKQTKKPTACFT